MYDRSYMTTNSEETAKKTLTWIIGANVVVFVLQSIFPELIARIFAFRDQSLQSGMVWTPLTYSFLHSPGGMPFHLIFNMVVIYFFGKSAIATLGQKRFLQFYFGAVLIGGFFWFAASFASGAGSVIGASAAASALLILFACLNPDREMLLFFVLPVKPRYLAYFLVGIAVLGLIFQELFNQGQNVVAHSAHLGGMLFAYLYYKYVYLPNPYDNSGALSLKFAGIFKKPKPEKSSAGYTYRVNVSKESKDLKGEVDRILDKINSKGFASLSEKEKEILDEARDLLRKR